MSAGCAVLWRLQRGGKGTGSGLLCLFLHPALRGYLRSLTCGSFIFKTATLCLSDHPFVVTFPSEKVLSLTLSRLSQSRLSPPQGPFPCELANSAFQRLCCDHLWGPITLAATTFLKNWPVCNLVWWHMHVIPLLRE